MTETDIKLAEQHGPEIDGIPAHSLDGSML